LFGSLGTKGNGGAISRDMMRSSLIIGLVLRKLNSMRILLDLKARVERSQLRHAWFRTRYIPKMQQRSLPSGLLFSDGVAKAQRKKTKGGVVSRRKTSRKGSPSLKIASLQRGEGFNTHMERFDFFLSRPTDAQFEKTFSDKFLLPKFRTIKGIEMVHWKYWYGVGLQENRLSKIDVFGLHRGGSRLCVVRVLAKSLSPFDPVNSDLDQIFIRCA